MAAFLGYFELSQFVGMVTAIVSAVTSWSEFTDVGRKVSRYSGVIRSLRKTKAWWESLVDVEKSGTENIHKLIMGTEEILIGELGSWQAVPAKKDDGKKNDEEDPKKK